MSTEAALAHDLSDCIKHFNENRFEFVDEHYKMFVVICDKEVIGFYDDVGSAYADAKNACGQKSFLVRQCLTVDEEKANAPVFRSRVA